MIKLKRKACEDCDGEQGTGSLKDKIYEAQLVNNREIIISGRIDESLVERVVIQIQNINRADDAQEAEFSRLEITGFKREPITVFISTLGGDVDMSFAVASAIESSKTLVKTVAIGMAMSGGFIILLSGHERYAQRYASLMYHELSSGTGGKATEVVEYGEYLEKLQKRISDFVVNNSGITVEDLDDCHLRKTDWYMDTFEAIDLGVVDGIWPPDMYHMEAPEDECDEDCECNSAELDPECVMCIEEGLDDNCDCCDNPNKPE